MKRTDPESVTVSFAVTFGADRFYSEDELGEPANGLIDRIRRAETIEGSIVIQALNRPTIRIFDEIAPWVQNLCFQAVATMSTGRPAQVSYFAREGFLHLTPDDDVVHIEGDRIPEGGHYPRRALFAALVDCGSRFIALAKQAKGDDANYMATIDYAQQFEVIARAGLEEWMPDDDS